MYYDINEDAHNQYFVMLFIKPESEDPATQLEAKWSSYQSNKALKMLAHAKLTRKLRTKVKNYLLRIKTDKEREVTKELSMNEYNWLSLNDAGDTKLMIQAFSGDKQTRKVIEDLYKIQRQLMNILTNHYSIRNSLDTHFVVDKLDDVNQVLNDTREFLVQRLQEIYYPNVSSSSHLTSQYRLKIANKTSHSTPSLR